MMRRHAALCVLAGVLAGCANKTVQQPPASPPSPAVSHTDPLRLMIEFASAQPVQPAEVGLQRTIAEFVVPPKHKLLLHTKFTIDGKPGKTLYMEYLPPRGDGGPQKLQLTGTLFDPSVLTPTPSNKVRMSLNLDGHGYFTEWVDREGEEWCSVSGHGGSGPVIGETFQVLELAVQAWKSVPDRPNERTGVPVKKLMAAIRVDPMSDKDLERQARIGTVVTNLPPESYPKDTAGFGTYRP